MARPLRVAVAAALVAVAAAPVAVAAAPVAVAPVPELVLVPAAGAAVVEPAPVPVLVPVSVLVPGTAVAAPVRAQETSPRGRALRCCRHRRQPTWCRRRRRARMKKAWKGASWDESLHRGGSQGTPQSRKPSLRLHSAT